MTRADPFRFTQDLRVRFVETDAQGVVYHANFLVYCEVGRVEYARAVLGAPGADKSRPWEPTVVRCELDLAAPARFDDLLTVALRCDRLGTTSYRFVYEIRRAGDVIARARTVQVVIDRATGAPRPLPEEMVAPILAFERVAPERGQPD